MATRAGDITFGVGFQVDKTGLQQVQQQLQQLQSGLKTTDIMKINNSSLQEAIQQLTKIQSTAQDVQNAMTKAFNPKIGSLNLSKFQSELKTAGHSIESIYKDCNMAGAAGQAAFRSVATQTLTANVQLKEHNKLLLDMGKTLANSFKYTISYGVINNLTGAIQSAFQYSKSLDSSLNDIRIVTDKSANDMERFAESANKAAKELGASTIDYTKASLIYYQQGLADEDVAARTDVTLKAANVTGQSTQEVSEQLTAVWNGYKVSAEEAELYVDKLAAVAATTASDLEELSTGMSKVASAANAMGVDIDQLNGMLSTIVSVTRQAPESAGTALKTIFARMGDLELNGEDEFGVSLGKVSSTLDSVGVKILDINGEIRDMGEVIEEVGNKWNTGAWTDAEKQALAIALAGKRQYNNLLALFDNWDMYNQAVTTSMEAQGTLQKQQDIYLESTAAHLQQMQTSWEGVKAAILKPDDINPVIDAIGDFGDITEMAIESLGGLKGILTVIGTVAMKAFGPSLGEAIAGFINNTNIAKANLLAIRQGMEYTNALRVSPAYAEGDPTITLLVEQAEKLESMYHNLDTTQVNTHKNLVENAARSISQLTDYNNALKETVELMHSLGDSSANQNSLISVSGQESLLNNLYAIEQNIDANKKLQASFMEVGEDYDAWEAKMAGSVDTYLKVTDKFNDVSEAAKKAKIVLQDFAKNTGAVSVEAAVDALRTLSNEYGSIEHKFATGAQAAKGYAEAQVEVARSLEVVNENAKSLETQDFTANIMSAVGSVGQLTMGVQSLTNAFMTLNNEDLSFGEKLSNFLINFTMGLPMAINGLKNLGTVFGVTSSIIDVFTAKKAASTAAINAHTAAQKLEIATQALSSQMDLGEIGSITALAKVRGIDVAAMTSEEALTQLLNIAQGENIVLDSTGIGVLVAYIAAKKADAAQTAKNVALTNAWNASLLANPIIWVTAIVVGLTAAYYAYCKHLENVAKAEREANLERIESNDKIIEEAENNKILVDSYNKLYNKYKTTGEAKEDLVASTEELIKQYGIEDGQLLLLQGDYDTLSQKINKAREAELERQKTTSQSNLRTISMDAEQAEQGKWYQRGVATTTYSPGTSRGELLLNAQVKNALTINERDEAGGKPLTDVTINVDWSDVNKAKEQIEALQQQLEDWDRQGVSPSDPLYKMIHDYLNNDTMSKYIEELNTNISNRNTALLQQTDAQLGLSQSKDFKEFKQKVDDFRKEMSTSFVKGDEVDSYISSLDSQYSKLYDSYSSQIHNLNDQARKFIDSLSEQDLQLFLTMKVDEQTSDKEIKEWLEREKRTLKVQNTYSISDTVSGLGEAIQDKKITKNEQKSINEQIASLSDMGYATEMEDFNNKSLIERLTILRHIEEEQAVLQRQQIEMSHADTEAQTRENERLRLLQMEQAVYDTMASIPHDDRQGNKNYEEAQANLVKIQQALKEIGNTKDLDSLENKLKEIFGQEYEINVVVNATTDEDILSYYTNQTEALTNEMDGLLKASELFEENWTVAQENASQMAKEMPYIFDGFEKINEDGSITFNKEHLNAILDTKQAEIEATRDTLLLELEADKQRLESKKSQLDSQIKIAHQLAEGEISIEQAKNQANELGLDKYGDFLTDQYNAWLKGADDTNAQIASSTTSLADAMVADINRVTAAWQQTWEAALTGGGVPIETAGASQYQAAIQEVSAKGKNRIEQYAAQSQKVANEASKAFGDILEKSLTQQREQVVKDIAAQDANISALKGSADKYINSLNRVKAGKAGKEPKSKSGSSAQPDKKDLLHAEKEIDVYHDINLELEEIEHQMKMLQKAEDKAFGKNYLNNLNAQNKLLEKQKKLLKEKLQLTANDMATRRAQLAEMGAAFDEEGYMTNYNALLTERLNKYNELVTAYNAMGTVQQKTSKQSIEDAKKEFDLLKERVSEYDKLFNSFNSLEEELQDKMDERIENQIKAFNYEVDVRLDMAEATRNWNDFYEKVIEDIEGIEDPVKKIITSMQTGLKNFESYYNGRDGLGSIQYLTEHVRETMAQVESIKNTGTSSVYGDNMSAAVEDLKKYNDSLMENLEDAQDIINKIKDSYLDAIDEANDKLEEQTKQYEYIADLINHDMNMVELLGGEDDYADLAKYYETMHANNMQNVEFLRMQRDAVKAQLDAVEEGSEAWKKLYEQVQDAQKDLNSAVEDSLNNIIDKYSNAIKNIFDKLNKSVTSGLGLDYMQESYDRQVDNGDNYLDDPNRLYAIEKIRNKYEDALNSTSDLAVQRKIADVMAQQLKYLEEKDQLSQYEVERAEKIYDLTMKQIALQEAQANKSQLRLKRDAQGNYSYQYVADQDAMNDAQQEVNDAMNDLYNFDLENYRDILGQATELTKEYEELVTEILENAALSEEERTQRLAEVKNWYYTEMNALEEQLAINKVNLQESANIELEELYRQNNEIFQGVIFEEMVPGWNGALDEMVTNFTEDFIPRCEESMRDLEAETEKYQNDVHALEQSANQDFTAIRGGIDLTITETQSLMHSNSELIDTYYREMGAITDVLGKLDDLIHKYDDVRDAAVRMAEAASQAYQQIQLTQYKAMEAEKFVGQGNLNNYNDAVSKVTNGGGSDRNGSSSGQTKSQNPAITIQGTYYWRVESSGITAASGGPMRMNEAKEKCEEVAKSILGNYTITLEGSTYVARKKMHVTSTYEGGKMTTQYWVGANPNYRFATGGYTGDWHSNDGKLAILDSKELVLNADDTKNMLDAVNVVRHIVASLDGSMNARVAGMAINPDISQALSQVGGASAIDQNVTISASFPNVSSHTEIEQAFENLVNRASQAAWSTRV